VTRDRDPDPDPDRTNALKGTFGTLNVSKVPFRTCQARL
jgi:hypothetical protein